MGFNEVTNFSTLCTTKALARNSWTGRYWYEGSNEAIFSLWAYLVIPGITHAVWHFNLAGGGGNKGNTAKCSS
jgi:hypothetical protein